MATILKCKMCGGDIEVNQDMTVGTCLYCGSTMTLPRIDSEKKARLFNRANEYRQSCEFDKAYRTYEAIVEEDEQESEAYWGLILAEYGVEYVEDPKTKKRIPTCHRTQTKFIADSTNYKLACQYADSEKRIMYEDEAEQLDKIQKRIISISAKEEPYDVFICYKESDDATGDRTQDSVLAYSIYEELTKRGIRTFMSRVTLADKLGQDYEPYIYSALSSARVMLVVATNGEHLDAIWVKNEWMRFLSFMKEDDSKTLIPVYKDMSPYEFPTELTRFQAQDMSKVGATQDLVLAIQKVIGAKKSDDTSAKINSLEREIKRRDVRTKRIIVVLSLLLAITVLVGGYVYFHNDSWRYGTAVRKMNNRQYVEASQIFDELNYYKDSKELYEKCSHLAKQQKAYQAYWGTNIGDVIHFENEELTWTCIDADNEKYILIADTVCGNMLRRSVNKYLDNEFVNTYFTTDEQEILFYFEENELTLLSEEQLIKYFPNENERITTLVTNSSVQSPWYVGYRDYEDTTFDNIRFVNKEGVLRSADDDAYAINKPWAGVRPVLIISTEEIPDL